MTLSPPAPNATLNGELPHNADPLSIAPTQHPTLPPLSEHDERLLETYIQLNANLDLLAHRTTTPVLHLLRWLNLSHIQPYLEALDKLRARQFAAEHDSDRRAAIDALKQVLADSQDPIEKRRAASAILRALNARPRTAHSSDLGPRTQDVGPSAPRPRARPSPSLSGQDAITTVLSALCDNNAPDDNSGLATLQAFCHKDATINGEPIPENLSAFLDDLDEETAEHLDLNTYVPGKLTESPTACSMACAQDRFALADIELARASESDPFLIKSIVFRDSS